MYSAEGSLYFPLIFDLQGTSERRFKRRHIEMILVTQGERVALIDEVRSVLPGANGPRTSCGWARTDSCAEFQD